MGWQEYSLPGSELSKRVTIVVGSFVPLRRNNVHGMSAPHTALQRVAGNARHMRGVSGLVGNLPFKPAVEQLGSGGVLVAEKEG